MEAELNLRTQKGIITMPVSVQGKIKAKTIFSILRGLNQTGDISAGYLGLLGQIL